MHHSWYLNPPMSHHLNYPYRISSLKYSTSFHFAAELTEPLCEPLRLVVVLHGDGAGVQEDQHDHEPEPGRSLETDVVARTFIVDVHLTSLAD